MTTLEEAAFRLFPRLINDPYIPIDDDNKEYRDKSKELDPIFEELVVNATSHLLPNFSRDLELSLN
jgi:hypothetical protein